MVIVFALTLLVSSLLLFLVQPMVGKMILPMFGGTPAVWNTCMVFFQAALLAGYAYAHGTVAWLGVRRQAVLHLAVLTLPLLVLPIALAAETRPPTDASPVLWLLGQLAIRVGLPFFVVSASAPLLQRWFAATDHPSARDPYFLYAVSNAGSLTALLAYPLLVEPAFALGVQSRLWFAGYGALIAMTTWCAVVVWRRATNGHIELRNEIVTDQPHFSPQFRDRLVWVVLALVPSSLMLGVTAHITTNLAPVPLLWVIPLALYLLSFVFVFARRPWIRPEWMTRALPFLVLPTGLLMFVELPNLWWMSVPLHLAMFFVAAMVCHGQLVQRRPPARYLTEFYLWMSVGGVLGGLFNAVVAPMLFTSLVEYPLMMVVACALRPALKSLESVPHGSLSRNLSFLRNLALPAAVIALAIGTALFVQIAGVSESAWMWGLVFGLPAMGCFVLKDRPVRFAICLATVLLACGTCQRVWTGQPLYAGRNFFGVKRIVLNDDGTLRKLMHGTTNHGCQRVDQPDDPEPLTYYHRTGPIGDVFTALAGTKKTDNVAIIGLGTGSIAAYAEPGQHFVFYEIDPDIERIARNPEYFTYLRDCRGRFDVILGDGRLALAEQPDGRFGLIILDAFSSDAIPTHLLSREAIEVYLAKLADDGVLVFHISNRYLNLQPVLAKLADTLGLVCFSRIDRHVSEAQLAAGKSQSHYVVLTRDARHLRSLAARDEWNPVTTTPNIRLWTDQYCNILNLFNRKALAGAGRNRG